MSSNNVQILTSAVLAALLSACTTTGGTLPVPSLGGARPAEQTAPAVAANELTPQTLDAGECGTFFWSADPDHRFLAFENETRGYAQIFINGGAQGFYMPRRDSLHVSGDGYRRSFLDPDRNLDIEIAGRVGESLPTGQRIERVVMRVEQPNGQRLVVPLIGHYACR